MLENSGKKTGSSAASIAKVNEYTGRDRSSAMAVQKIATAAETSGSTAAAVTVDNDTKIGDSTAAAAAKMVKKAGTGAGVLRDSLRKIRESIKKIHDDSAQGKKWLTEAEKELPKLSSAFDNGQEEDNDSPTISTGDAKAVEIGTYTGRFDSTGRSNELLGIMLLELQQNGPEILEMLDKVFAGSTVKLKFSNIPGSDKLGEYVLSTDMDSSGNPAKCILFTLSGKVHGGDSESVRSVIISQYKSVTGKAREPITKQYYLQNDDNLTDVEDANSIPKAVTPKQPTPKSFLTPGAAAAMKRFIKNMPENDSDEDPSTPPPVKPKFPTKPSDAVKRFADSMADPSNAPSTSLSEEIPPLSPASAARQDELFAAMPSSAVMTTPYASSTEAPSDGVAALASEGSDYLSEDLSLFKTDDTAASRDALSKLLKELGAAYNGEKLILDLQELFTGKTIKVVEREVQNGQSNFFIMGTTDHSRSCNLYMEKGVGRLLATRIGPEIKRYLIVPAPVSATSHDPALADLESAVGDLLKEFPQDDLVHISGALEEADIADTAPLPLAKQPSDQGLSTPSIVVTRPDGKVINLLEDGLDESRVGSDHGTSKVALATQGSGSGAAADRSASAGAAAKGAVASSHYHPATKHALDSSPTSSTVRPATTPVTTVSIEEVQQTAPEDLRALIPIAPTRDAQGQQTAPDDVRALALIESAPPGDVEGEGRLAIYQDDDYTTSFIIYSPSSAYFGLILRNFVNTRETIGHTLGIDWLDGNHGYWSIARFIGSTLTVAALNIHLPLPEMAMKSIIVGVEETELYYASKKFSAFTLGLYPKTLPDEKSIADFFHNYGLAIALDMTISTALTAAAIYLGIATLTGPTAFLATFFVATLGSIVDKGTHYLGMQNNDHQHTSQVEKVVGTACAGIFSFSLLDIIMPPSTNDFIGNMQNIDKAFLSLSMGATIYKSYEFITLLTSLPETNTGSDYLIDMEYMPDMPAEVEVN